MNGCLYPIFWFILCLIILALLFRFGVFTMMAPVFSELLDLISAVIRELTHIVINGAPTPPDYNQLFNIYQ